MPKGNKIDSIKKEERIHEVSLLMRRKSVKFIIEHIKEKWNLQTGQAYNYLKDAKVEWQKYFLNLKNAGMGYHISQIRDLKDKILEKKTLNKDDYRLILDVYREESKLMGAYPAEKFEVTEKKVVVIGRKDKKDDDEECKKQQLI